MAQLPDVDYKSVFETVPGLFLVLTPDLIIVAASNAFLETTLTERNALIGRGLLEAFPGEPGGDHARSSVNYVLQHGRPNKMKAGKYYIPGKDGTFTKKHWEALNVPIFDDQHKIAYILHSLVPVTAGEHPFEAEDEQVMEQIGDVYKSEKKFRALIENSDDIITLMNGSFKLIYRSPCATRVLGWTDDDMIGVDATRNIHPEDKAYAAALVKKLMAGPGEVINARLRMMHKDGHYLWLEGTLTNLLEDKNVQAILFNFRNVTKRIEAEKKLTASEKQFRNTLDHLLEGIQIIDFNWRYIYVNDALTRYSRRTKEELIGHTVMEAYPGVEQTDLFKVLTHCMKERTSQKLETEFVFPDGSRSDFQLSIQPHPSGILILSIDITKARKTENALKEEQEKFARIAATSPGLIYSFRLAQDGTMSFPYASNAFEEIFGLSYDIAAGNAQHIINRCPVEDKEYVLGTIAASARDMLPWQLQFSYNHPGKGLVWLYGHSIPTTAPDGSILWHGIITDITGKKKAEQELKRNFEEKQALAERMSIILNTLPARIALLDGNGIIMEVNDAWRNLAGENTFMGSNYGTGDNYLDISKSTSGKEGEDGRKAASGIQSVLKKKQNEFVYEYPFHSHKTKRWFRMVASPLQEKDHAGAVVMHIDISELRRLEEERMKSKIEEQKKITKAMIVGEEKERNHLGQELHDNINQILVSTRMLLSVAGNDNKEVKELIKYPLELLDTSIDEIRTLCHKMVTPLKNIDLEELIRDMLGKLEQATKIKTALLYAVNNGALSDELQLNIYRILQELMNNIHKYSAASHVSVSLKTANRAIAIKVTDDGKGFDFKKKRKGVGISNIMNRVGSFNGEVNIESSEGNGCTTNIFIPY